MHIYAEHDSNYDFKKIQLNPAYMISAYAIFMIQTFGPYCFPISTMHFIQVYSIPTYMLICGFLGPWLFSYIISSAYTIFYPSCHQRKRLLHLGLKYWICSGLGKKTWIKHLRSIENAQPLLRSSSYTISFCCSVEKSHMLDSTIL